MKKLQALQLIEYLQDKKEITGIEAVKKLGILSYTKRISELRRLGAKIITEFETKRDKFGVTRRYGRFVLVKDARKVIAGLKR